uniref:Uncharacterized protein n=1 Tax=Helianthus annuus TaxID=4232 RepID=A0A251VQM4_HELAN
MRFIKIRQANLQWRLVEGHSQQQVSISYDVFLSFRKVRGPCTGANSHRPHHRTFIAIIVRKVKEFATWISQSISKLIPEKPFVIKLHLKVYAYVK